MAKANRKKAGSKKSAQKRSLPSKKRAKKSTVTHAASKANQISNSTKGSSSALISETLKLQNELGITTIKTELEIAKNVITEKILPTQPPGDDIDISESYGESIKFLKGYATLDFDHIENISTVINDIYDYANDKGKKRPLNIMLRAEPGSGKSHLIECIIKKLQKTPRMLNEFGGVVFNMAAMERLNDLESALESVRNLKVNDVLPILFLDEFDSSEKNFPALLPLMWDGAMRLGHHDLKVGKVVIVLAGSQKKLDSAIESSKGMRKEILNVGGKFTDLLSRINGGELTIPDLDFIDGTRNRKVDKICISISLILNRFKDKDIAYIPWSLLNFISRIQFRYGVRSISNLIDFIPLGSTEHANLKIDYLDKEFSYSENLKKSNLARHIICEDGPAHVVKIWNEVREHSNLVKVTAKEPASESVESLELLLRFLEK